MSSQGDLCKPSDIQQRALEHCYMKYGMEPDKMIIYDKFMRQNFKANDEKYHAHLSLIYRPYIRMIFQEQLEELDRRYQTLCKRGLDKYKGFECEELAVKNRKILKKIEGISVYIVRSLCDFRGKRYPSVTKFRHDYRNFYQRQQNEVKLHQESLRNIIEGIEDPSVKKDLAEFWGSQFGIERYMKPVGEIEVKVPELSEQSFEEEASEGGRVSLSL